MAELVVTQDELALRRRARRRLVGAVAIALTCVVALPMLFDSEPKPLGPEVDIRIPAQDTPFEAAPVVTPPVQPVPEAKPAEPTQPHAPEVANVPATLPAKTATTVESGKSKPGVGAAETEASTTAENDKAKLSNKPPPAATTPVENQKLKQQLKPDMPFAAQGYFLQIGAFGSEANARQLQEKATAAGFKAVMNGTNGQFRVRVGPISQHERALEMQAKLKAKGFSPVLLGP
jgi:DedD protein